MIEFHAALIKAIADGRVTIDCIDQTSAANMRQKFYRYRDKIKNSDEELSLLVDNFHFELKDQFLTIHYDSNESLLEALSHDTENTGAKALNSSQRHEPRKTPRPACKGG